MWNFWRGTFESLWIQGWNPLYLPLCIFRPSCGPVLWQDRDVKCRQHCSVQSCRGYYYFLKKVQPFVQAGNSSSGHIWVCLQVNIHELDINFCHSSHKWHNMILLIMNCASIYLKFYNLGTYRKIYVKNNLMNNQLSYFRFNWRNYVDLISNDL